MSTGFSWGPYGGAVSFTFDDGHPSQLEKAVPAMDERNLKGTFSLCPGGSNWRERMEPWRAVAARIAAFQSTSGGVPS
jgi:peptidoglycan/xylan/chitin deacetylase (PgdA/CDA1 family)